MKQSSISTPKASLKFSIPDFDQKHGNAQVKTNLPLAKQKNSFNTLALATIRLLLLALSVLLHAAISLNAYRLPHTITQTRWGAADVSRSLVTFMSQMTSQATEGQMCCNQHIHTVYTRLVNLYREQNRIRNRSKPWSGSTLPDGKNVMKRSNSKKKMFKKM